MECEKCSAPVSNSADCCPVCGSLVPIPGHVDPQERLVVGLMGFAGVGKDTAAEGLVERGWTRVAFATPLKKIATHIGWNGKKDAHGRVLLQHLGVAVRDHVHPDAWVWAAERTIDATDGDVVVTDVRFPNEAEMVRRYGGLLVRVRRPGFERPVNGHVSETAWHGVESDLVVENVRGPSELRKGLVEGVTALTTGRTPARQS